MSVSDRKKIKLEVESLFNLEEPVPNGKTQIIEILDEMPQEIE